MFKWLQTSLFGPKEETHEPAHAVKAIRPASRKAPLKTASSSLPGAFLDRWKSLVSQGDIEIVPVPRLRQGWRLEWRRGDQARLRVPAAILTAPDEILGALAAWARLVMNSRGKAKSAAAQKERSAARQALEKTLHAWLDQHAARDPRTRTLARARAERRLDRLESQGKHHDLQAIFDAVNREYFAGALEARITWSKRWGGLSTQSHAKDAEGNRYNLITISRGYDSALASAEMVGGVVYHECLHIAVPPKEGPREGEGRRVVHGREFRRREREYRFYEAWRLWHAKVLPGIVRRGAPRDGRRG
jgi:hypothetical protein